MPALKILPKADGKFPELQGKRIHHSRNITVASLDGGMASGKPSVALLIHLDDGSVVFAETSLELFVAAGRALAVAHEKDVEPSE